MRVPLYNDYPLPAQQAGAAATQHPMLAPRPIDATAAGYQSYPPYESVPLEGDQSANASQFYYPTPPVQDVPLSTQPLQRNAQERKPSTTTVVSGLPSPAVASSEQSDVLLRSATANQRGQTHPSWTGSAAPGTSEIGGEKFRSQVRTRFQSTRTCMATVLTKSGPLLWRCSV